MLDQKLKYRRFKAYLEQVLGRTFTDDEFDNIAETLRVSLEQSVMMGYRYDKAVLNNPGYADELFTLWITNQNDTQHLLDVMEIVANQNPNQPPVPPAPPSGGSNIVRFDPILTLDDPDNCYFTGCRVNDQMRFCTYKDGSQLVYMVDINRKELARFNAESGFMIIYYKGRYYLSLEHGQWGTVNRGMIMRLEANGNWYEVYRHPRWDLITEMHVHTDGWLYASGNKWGTPSDPGGIVRTFDGDHWEVYYERNDEVRSWGMTSLSSHLVTAGTTRGTDWGGNGCHPAIIVNKDLVWTDPDHEGSGFWAAEAWHADVFFGRCGEAGVVRLSDKKEVLSMPGFDAIHDLAIDKKTDTLLAFCNRPNNGGAVIKGTKTGNPGDWHTVGAALSVPSIIDAYYDDKEDVLYLMGGLFAGHGRVHRSIRA